METDELVCWPSYPTRPSRRVCVISERTEGAADAPPGETGQRLGFLDNLKVALTVLVVLHHAAQPYGPPDWWYVPGGRRETVLASFTVVNGSFFMALFFAISAYLVPSSYDRKGSGAFLVGRLKRIGIPFAVGTLTIVPLLMYVYFRVGRDHPPLSFPAYYSDVFLGLGGKPEGWTGPTWPDLQFAHLWFLEHLLVYGLLYTIWRVVTRRVPARPTIPRPPPGNAAVLASVFAIAGLSAAIRVYYPVDHWEAVLGFVQAEVSDLGQYASLFVIGLIAYRRDWLTRFPAPSGYLWLAIGSALALGYGVGRSGLDPYFAGGGANLPQLTWSGYESAMCVSLCVGLVVLFREKLNHANSFSRILADDSFTVYIIHVPVVVLLQLGLMNADVSPLAAFALVGSCGVASSFTIAHLLRKLPGARSVL